MSESTPSTTSAPTRRSFVQTSAALASGTLLAGAGFSGEQEVMVQINAMNPTEEQRQAFAALPDDGPLVMLNLLKFKADGGQAEYMRYGAGVQPLLARHGARSIFVGRPDFCLVGNAIWDMVALVEYPGKAAFFAMTSSPEYQAIHPHREAGLEGQVLYAMTRIGPPLPA